MVNVVIFVNGEFSRVITQSSVREAFAYTMGVSAGAGEFSGDMSAFVWPDEKAAMEDCYSDAELANAMLAIGEQTSP